MKDHKQFWSDFWAFMAAFIVLLVLLFGLSEYAIADWYPSEPVVTQEVDCGED